MINSNTALPSHFHQPVQGYQSHHPTCQHKNFRAPQQNQQSILQQQSLSLLLPLLAQLINQLGQGQPAPNQTPQNQVRPNPSGNCACSPQSQSDGFTNLLTDVAQAESAGLSQAANTARSRGFTNTAQFLDDAALGAQHGNPLEQISAPGQPSPEAILEGFLKPAQFGLNNLLADANQAQSEGIQLKAELESVLGRGALQGNTLMELSRDAARGRLIRNHQIDPSVFSSPLPEGLNPQQQAEVLAQRAGKAEAIPQITGQPAASGLQSQQDVLTLLVLSLITQLLPQISTQ